MRAFEAGDGEFRVGGDPDYRDGMGCTISNNFGLNGGDVERCTRSSSGGGEAAVEAGERVAIGGSAMDALLLLLLLPPPLACPERPAPRGRG